MSKANIPMAVALVALTAFSSSPEMPAEFMADREAVVAAARGATTLTHPDADFVILDDRIHVSYEPDGTYLEWDDEWTKALTEKGRRSLSSLSLNVKRRYGDAAIQKVEIFDAEGRARAVDFESTLKEATDNSYNSMNIYDPMDRRLQCSVPGLEVGEVRHVVTCRRIFNPRMRGTFADMELLEMTVPILSARVTVDEPASNKLRHAVVRRELQRRIEELPVRPLASGRTLREWRADNVPQIFPEPDMPPLFECARVLYISTAEDWPTVSRWYWNLCLPHLGATTEAMSNKVEELVRELPDDVSKVRAVFRFVSQQVRYMGLTLEDVSPGYAPHDVSLTFANRYGVCRDKAALLVAMLRIAGFKAYPVLIHAGGKMDSEVPMPYFNHAVAAVSLGAADPDGEPFVLMDPTDESARDLFPSYLANCSYLVATPEGEPLRRSPVRPWRENSAKISTVADVSDDGTALVEIDLKFSGINDTVFRHSFRRRTPKERRETAERIVRSALPGAKILSFKVEPEDLSDTEKPMSMKIAARARDLVLRGETRDSLHVPDMAAAFGVVGRLLDSTTSLEHRRFPLKFSCTAGVEERLEIRLGDALGDLISVPPAISISNGGYTFERDMSVSNGTLVATGQMVLGKVEVSPEEYLDLKFARKEQEGALRHEPVFASRSNDNANVRFTLSSSSTHLASARSWVTTNVYEKEVLTYQGKKASSELKFSYNPAVMGVEIVSATVSNANGRVASISPREVNLLDAGWAAAAPRYTAGKILVANLPAVEKGSVIRIKAVDTVTNAPIAFTDFLHFDFTDPVEEARCELRAAPGVDFALLTGAGFTELVRTNEFVRHVVRPRRLIGESMTPPASFWREVAFVTAVDWEDFASGLEDALAAARAAGSEAAAAKAAELVAGIDPPEEKIAAIRKFLVSTIKIAGPGIYELPFDRAFFPPDRSLADGYASRADWFNLYFAMLEAVGFSPSIMLSSNDDGGYPSIAARYADAPRPIYFNSFVLRVDAGNRRWFWPFGEERVLWLGAENEYTPVEASAHFGDSAFDLSAREIVRISPAAGAKDVLSRSERTRRLEVRESGAVDFSLTNRTWGAGVGPFRKRYAEMLPEKRSRHYMELLGDLAENASATSELFTDVESYPAVFAYSAYVEDMAVVKDGTMTLKLPGAAGSLFPSLDLENGIREAPISVSGADESVTRWEVVCPKGYSVAESLPADVTLVSPVDGRPWFAQKVSTRREEGRGGELLVVEVERRVFERPYAAMLPPDRAALLREWNRVWGSPANRTIVVRRP